MSEVKRHRMLDPDVYNRHERRDLRYIDVVLASDFDQSRDRATKAEARVRELEAVVERVRGVCNEIAARAQMSALSRHRNHAEHAYLNGEHAAALQIDRVLGEAGRVCSCGKPYNEPVHGCGCHPDRRVATRRRCEEILFKQGVQILNRYGSWDRRQHDRRKSD